jgi:hypothetical protein
MAIYPQEGTDLFGGYAPEAPPEAPMEAPMEAPPEAMMSPPEEAPAEEPEAPEFEAILRAIQEALNTPDKSSRFEVFKKFSAAFLKQVEGIQTLDMGNSRIRA